jgi:hypothetical protein
MESKKTHKKKRVLTKNFLYIKSDAAKPRSLGPHAYPSYLGA